MKELGEMSLAELWELFPIILREHNPEYGQWYEEERTRLTTILKDSDIFRISHIGSTYVRGLISKPTIDILLEFNEFYDENSMTQILLGDGWLVMGRNPSERTVDLNKGYTKKGFAEKVYHLHIKPAGDHSELYFRDYLTEHPDVAEEYGVLKIRLKEEFEHDRDAYTSAKTDFVEKYSSLARDEYGGRYTPKVT